tara:strand:+ start:544 stop:1086 length:543 start_codon:yes stop_codon:yes gene_type:complete
MSTRSNVAVVDPADNKVKVIYVHGDGYPDGVGNCLLKYYNNFKKADELVNKGSASYLDETLEGCEFYETEEDSFVKHNNEYCFMNSMRGDFMIEYIYMFRNNEWVVSTMKSIKQKPKDGYDNFITYWTKFIPIKKHKEYTAPKELKHGEVKMVANLKKMLSDKFGEDNIISQGRKIKKLN